MYYIYAYYLRLFIILYYYKISAIVPCAIPYVLYWLSILYVAGCICYSQTPNLFHHPLSTLVLVSLFSVCVSIFVL